MAFNPTTIRQTTAFKSRLKRLARRYPAVLDVVEDITHRLAKGERPGKLYRRVGATVFRERLPNPSARRGKSGGFRVAYLVEDESNVVLLGICVRNDCPELQETSIRRLLREEGY